MISILDYGVGNVKAFANIYHRLGIPYQRVSCPEQLICSTHLILPGVGSFDYAMSRFRESGLLEPVQELVLTQQIPILGICVGMQMLADSSEEGGLSGLGWIPGRIKKLRLGPDSGLPLPHMGWNSIQTEPALSLFGGLEQHPEFYFLHSYYFECDDCVDAIATANYGTDFCCAVNKGAIFGVQFHPEKSHGAGIALLENFSRIVC